MLDVGLEYWLLTGMHASKRLLLTRGKGFLSKYFLHVGMELQKHGNEVEFKTQKKTNLNKYGAWKRDKKSEFCAFSVSSNFP